MNSEKPVSLKIVGPSYSYEMSIEEALVPQIMAICITKTTNHVSLDHTPSTSTRVESGVMESVSEFIIRIGAKRNPDKILAFACYLRDQLHKASVLPAEIKHLFREAGEALPANFSRDFNDVTTSGWMAKEPQKDGYFYVTNTGSAVLAKGFDKAALKRLKKATIGKKKPETIEEGGTILT